MFNAPLSRAPLATNGPNIPARALFAITLLTSHGARCRLHHGACEPTACTNSVLISQPGSRADTPPTNSFGPPRGCRKQANSPKISGFVAATSHRRDHSRTTNHRTPGKVIATHQPGRELQPPCALERGSELYKHGATSRKNNSYTLGRSSNASIELQQTVL